MIDWKHIMDEQPAQGEMIVQCEPPFEGHYTMGMRQYHQNCSFDDIIKFHKESDLNPPNFWWVSAKDFPFPGEKND